MASRADHFAFCWREEPPAANGWRSDYGHDRLVPFATDFGPIDFPAGARQMVGPLTPEALEAICTEPPHGLPDLEHDGPRIWKEGELPPSPWWFLLLLSGQDALLESRANGDHLSLSLMPEELAQLNLPQGRIHDHALANRQGRTWVALKRPVEERVIAGRSYTDFQFFGVSCRYSEIRLEGRVISSLTVEPDALEALMVLPDPGVLLADAPAHGHLLVFKKGETVCWREVESPNEP